MRVRLSLMIASAMAAAALLVPAASAQAVERFDPWCGGVTLAPGQSCTSWPLHVNSISAWWTVSKAGTGRVCVGLTQWPAKTTPVPGYPGLNCGGVGGGVHYGPDRTYGAVGDEGLGAWQIYRYNPYLTYSYAYGQARIMNISSATIKVGRSDVTYVHHSD
jgi:hypothetical protein